MISLLYIVGFEFVEMYQKLITPPGGKERKSIRQKVMAIVDGAVEADINDLFEKKVAEHVYYVIGFLCDAGSKEAKQWTTENDVGECIKALNLHFALTGKTEPVAKIKDDLPSGS